MVFPDGRLPSRRWRPVLWLGAVAVVAGFVGRAFTPGPFEDLDAPVQNPYGLSGQAGQFAARIEEFGFYALVLAVSMAAVGLTLRFMRSHGAERQQLKGFTFVLMMTLAAFLIAGPGVGVVDDTGLLPYGWADLIGNMAWVLLLFNLAIGIPLTLAIAVFRYRLYDIDLVIKRTLVYGLLTAALLTMYLVSVVLLGRVLSPAVGQSDLAIAASTLAVAVLFHPARNGIQRAIDRRLYRRRFDATQALNDFATRLPHELDLNAVRADLCATADEAVQPTHVSIWLRI
jgi:hypothetical protein